MLSPAHITGKLRKHRKPPDQVRHQLDTTSACEGPRGLLRWAGGSVAAAGVGPSRGLQGAYDIFCSASQIPADVRERSHQRNRPPSTGMWRSCSPGSCSAGSCSPRPALGPEVQPVGIGRPELATAKHTHQQYSGWVRQKHIKRPCTCKRECDQAAKKTWWLWFRSRFWFWFWFYFGLGVDVDFPSMSRVDARVCI